MEADLDDVIGTVRWFGKSWGAPVCDPRAHIPTPIGSRCEGCGHPVTEDDNGVTMPYWDGTSRPGFVAFHRECNLRHVMGCSASLRGEGHDHERDYREDALAVEQWIMQNPLR